MVAVAHATQGEVRRLVVVRTGPSVVRSGRLAQRVPAHVDVPITVYRRRRAVALLVVATALAAFVLLLQGIAAPFAAGAPGASEPSGARAAVYVVQPGDTFWAIAGRLHPGEDPRPLVARLVAAHGSPTLVPGERLRLPDGA